MKNLKHKPFNPNLGIRSKTDVKKDVEEIRSMLNKPSKIKKVINKLKRKR